MADSESQMPAKPAPLKIGLVSLGCPKNLVDGEVMLGLTREAGHEITADAREADVIVVNTCAFIDRAKDESIDAVLEMARLKREGSCQRLVVTGCLAERYREQLQAEIPEIDAVLGTGDVPAIVGAVEGRGSVAPLQFYGPDLKVRPTYSAPDLKVRPTYSAPDLKVRPTYGAPDLKVRPTYLYDASTPRVLTTSRHLAYVKVAEGCDYTCAFCIIPTLRGAYRSRDDDSIVTEAERLAAGGVRELLLISQDTTFFGVDRGQRGALARLLRRLNAVPGLAWIRLLYLYPTTITDDVLDAMAECEKVCRYVDLPLQHASADVLRRMRRPGTRDAYDRLIARIRTRVPGVSLRTTFIVGFPGETAADLAELAGFIGDTGFDHVGVFTYSHEDGTRAFASEDDVPAAVKRQRRAAIMRQQERIVRQRLQARIGERTRVMLDGPSPDSPLVFQGRLEGQAPDIDSVVYLDGFDPATAGAGDLIEVHVTGARGYDLIAAPLPAERTA